MMARGSDHGNGSQTTGLSPEPTRERRRERRILDLGNAKNMDLVISLS